MAALRRLAAHYVYTPQGLQRDVVVTFDGDGTVLDLTSTASPDAVHGVEFYSGILIPGMVNAHCHLELSHMKGLIPQGCGFAGFGQGMSEFRGSHTQHIEREAAAYGDAKMWSEGTSAVGDISNGDTTLDIKAISPVSYHTFVEVYGLGVRSTQRFDALLRLTRERGLAGSLTPHSMYSLNEGLLQQTVSGNDGILSIHFMESRQERDLFEGRGEMRSWFDEKGFREDFTPAYDSPARRLVKTIPPTVNLLLVHNTFVTGEEVEMINGHFGQNVTWVLCPRSNRYITGATAPVDILRKKGCRIAIGTDSLASNTSLSLVEELKTFGTPIEEMVGWVTKNGAAALGMQESHGAFGPGMKPGAVLIEKADLNNMKLTAESFTRRLV